MAFISEDDLEQMSLEWFQEIGYTLSTDHYLLLTEIHLSVMTFAKWCSLVDFGQH